jgi:hypothetical protein
MSQYILLAQFFSQSSLSGHALNALPDAPVHPHVERRFHLRSVGPALRSRFTPSATRMNPAECAPAA